MPLLALVGDYSSEVPAHRAIPRAIELACEAAGGEVSWRWLPTGNIRDAAQDLVDVSAVWVVPASPYVNMRGALDAIRWARETERPFLGTCGGFQHALIEYARNVACLADADHAESNAHADAPLVTQLDCPLVERTGTLHFAPGSRLRNAYGKDEATERYHCRYGLNAAYRVQLEKSGVCFSGFDDAGEVRAFELASHRFFIGTLFQPERRALDGEAPPLICAFVEAILCSAGRDGQPRTRH